ncbi:MAG TPA: fatty acid desaturase [Terracidiphilus sp.]|nr:fatty acid desaturase [Terracidiphilus sp.]
MAASLTAPPHQTTSSDPLQLNEQAEVQPAGKRIHVLAARDELRMGKAVSLEGGINWTTTSIIALLHAGALAAFFFFTWQRLAVMAIIYIVAINVGIGMCYHRLLTHRGYQVPKWLEYLMSIGATLSLEGGPIFWVATHRVHHQLSDHHGDPHTPREGGWWAHTGWLLFGDALHAQTKALSRYVPDLSRDRFHVWLSKYHWLPITLSAVLLFGLGWAFGGWKNAVGMVLWGGFLRVTLGLHATWLVNSATHLWGRRRFDTHDDSRNNWWVALLSGGEGWHNNHHAHPVSARHGLAWYEIDPNFWGIWLLAKVGLARKIRVAKYDRANPKPAGL